MDVCGDALPKTALTVSYWVVDRLLDRFNWHMIEQAI